MTCREAVNNWLKEIKIPAGSFVLDVGSSSNPVSKMIDFNDSSFMTWDIDPDAKCDYTEDITDENGWAGDYTHLFCISVLEHLYNPYKALENMHALLADNGILYLATPFEFEEHGDFDYLRYTPKGLKKILEIIGFKVLNNKVVKCDNGIFILTEAKA